MMFAPMLLAVPLVISFPAEDARLPAIDNVYVVGATRRGDTNVVVNGENVSVYRTGAWATLVKVSPGTNTVEAVSQSGERASVSFRIAERPPEDPNAAPHPEKVWKKLEYAKDEAKAPPTNRPPAAITLVIDPGHGGSDTGAVSPHGFFEKDANLQTALKVRDELSALGYRVAMTREDDSFPPLYARPKLAHRLDAAAFVSIHHNAPPYDRDPSLRYHAVYAWNPIGESIAGAISAKLGEELGGELKSNGVMHANFAVTRNPEIPSCLVEVDFVTSPPGEEAIWNAARRARVAKAIASGIDAWCRGDGNNKERKRQ